MKKIFLLVLMLAGLMPISAIAQIRPFKALDVFELEYATDPQFMADANSVIYVRNFMDIMTDRKRSNLWRVDVDGTNHRPVTTGLNNNNSPRFSPDGTMLAYLSNASGKSQIMIHLLKTGETYAAAQLQNGVDNITWSPDSQSIAFSAFIPGKQDVYAPLPPRPKGAEWAKEAIVLDKTLFTNHGSELGKLGNDHIFIVPKTGGTPRQITSGDFNHHSNLSWDQKGKRIYFSANRKENHIEEPQDSEIYGVNVQTGDIIQLTDRFGIDTDPVVSPNGKWIAYAGFDDKRSEYHNVELYIMKLDGSEGRSLTKNLDINVSDISWADNSRDLYFRYSDHSEGKVSKINLNGQVTDFTNKVGGTSFGRPYGGGGDYALSAKGDIAFTMGSVYDQSNISLVNKSGGGEIQLTSLNDDVLGHRDLAKVEEINYKSSYDNIDIQGWLMKPTGFDATKKYPLILEIHGGPIANYGAYFSSEMQLMASAGYMVLYVNQRGSTSYGEDFANLLHHNYPNHDFDDVMSGVDHAISLGNVDEDRLYIAGGSNGGILSSWAIGKTDRFKAAAVIKPLTNWVTGVLNSALARFSLNYEFAKPPWEDPEEYWKRSPLSLVGNVKTPTMLMTGELDSTTPIAESEQYYQALKMRGIEAILVRIPGSGHGIASRPSNLITKTQHTIKWFDDHK